MIARYYIESARDKARALKWELAKTESPTLSRERLAEKAAWIADYLSELLAVIDSDVFLRTIVSADNTAEVCFKKLPSAEEIQVLQEVLAISLRTFSRQERPNNAGVEV